MLQTHVCGQKVFLSLFQYRLLLSIVMLIATSFTIKLFAQQPLFTNYTIQSGLPSNTIYYTMEDSNGFLWIGTDAGVCRYDGRR